MEGGDLSGDKCIIIEIKKMQKMRCTRKKKKKTSKTFSSNI